MSSEDAAASILVFAPALDFPRACAETLVAWHRAELPDLSALTLLLPQASLRAPLQAALARAAGGAVLAPRIETLASFAAERAPDALAPLHCRLRLAEELGRFRGIFPAQDPQRAADALFALCEELTLESSSALDDDETAFAERLRRAYGAPESVWLSREAQIVHRIWAAYRESFGAAAPAIAYRRGLQDALRESAGPIYWLGFDRLADCEHEPLKTGLREGRMRFWAQGRLDGRDGAALRRLIAALDPPQPPFVMCAGLPVARTHLLDAALSADARPPRERRPADSVSGHGLSLVAARDAEHEARCVDLAVREALLGGARKVAVVTGDRRLARRLRALLERAGIALHDRIGWPLSTSRAAAALDAWLGTVERDFHYRPLLDLLRSDFFAATGAEAGIAEVLAGELVFGAPSVVGGLRQWQARSAALQSPSIERLFERLQRAAAELPLNARPQPAQEWPAAVRRSLHLAGLLEGLRTDAAGTELLAELALLESTLAGLARPIGWSEFRRLLDRRLEEARFVAGRANDEAQPRVLLSAPEQTQGLRAEVLICAGLTPAQLPGRGEQEPFFNAAVRQELGLEGPEARQGLSLLRFRRLLESADRVVLTYAPERADESAVPAPWVEALAAFAAECGAPLEDTMLPQRARQPEAEIVLSSPTPAVTAIAAAPPADLALLDFRLSATAHQALIDCPYRFHARQALNLHEPQAPDAPPGRADFGEVVHRILHAFYQPHAGWPSPYAGPLDTARVDDVAAHLAQLAEAAFAPEITRRPLAEVWRREFLALAPWLASVLAARGAGATRLEQKQQRMRGGWTLEGRPDRVEHGTGGETIVDYKTGRVPKNEAIDGGEAVQLPHYALLFERAQAAEYWNLQKRAVEMIDRERLAILLPEIEQRLATLALALREGAPLRASGEWTVCRRCEFSGVCRRWAVPPATGVPT